MSVKKKPIPKAAQASPQPAAESKPAATVLPGFFEKPGSKVIYAAIGIIALIAFIVFKDFLLFNKIYLYKDVGDDSINQFLPFMEQAARDLKKSGGFTWSFNVGMGQNFNSFAWYDPFDVFLYYLTPGKMMWMLGYKEFFKIILSGAVFFAFLRTAGRSKYASTVGAMMFAFCGFMIVGSSGWYFLSFDAFNAALFLLAFELLYKKNIPWLMPLPVFLFGISRPFNLVLYAFFMTAYILFRYFQDDRKNYKELAILFLKIIALGFIGLALSTPVLIDQLQAMIESPRASGQYSFFHTLATSPVFSFAGASEFGTGVNRFFCSELLGSGSKYRGWINIMEAPQFYCGIPCLLLTPLVFTYLNRKQKTLFGIILGAWLLPFVMPYFRYALWVFSGNYYRTYSVFVALVFIIYSAFCLDKILEVKKINVTAVIVIAVCLLILQALPYFDNSRVVDSGLAFIVRIFTIAYAGIIIWMAKSADRKIPMLAFLGLLALELTWFSYKTVNRNTNITAADMKERIGYNDYTKDALAIIKKRDTAFYRIDRDVSSSPAIHGSLNEGMNYDYNGTSLYTSFNQKYYIKYMQTYRVVRPEQEEDSRWTVGLASRPILQSLNSVKYILSKNGYANSIWRVTTDSIGKAGDVLILKNKFMPPFGYTYKNFIRYSELMKLSITQRDFMSLRAAVVNEDDLDRAKGLTELHASDSIDVNAFNLNLYKQYCDSLSADTLQISTFTNTHLAGKMHFSADKIAYLSIPYDIGWRIQVDGKPYQPLLLSNGMMGVAGTTGEHSIDLQYQSPYKKEGKMLHFAALFAWIGVVGVGFWRRRKKE